MKDTVDASEAIARLANDTVLPNLVINAVGTMTQRNVGPPETWSRGGLSGYAGFKTERIDRVKLKAAMKPNFGNVNLMDKARLLGFSPYDFVPTIWELIPYSFVVDYFTNAGEVIESATALDVRYLWGQETIVAQQMYARVFMDARTTPATHAGTPGRILNEYSLQPGKWQHESTSVSRAKVDVSTLVPAFHFKMPGMRQNLNLAALLASHSRAVSNVQRK
jgi:hypothetical protein